METVGIQLVNQFGDQGPDFPVQRTDPTETLVVVGNLQHSIAWDIPSAGHVFEERKNVIGAFRTTEGDYEYGIEGRKRRGEGGISHHPSSIRYPPSAVQEMTPTGFE